MLINRNRDQAPDHGTPSTQPTRTRPPRRRPPRDNRSVARRWAISAILPIACGLAASAAADESDAPAGIRDTQSVTLQGDVPFDEIPGIQERSNRIWVFLADRFDLPSSVAPPVIYFYPFKKEIQSAEWTAWQKAWTRTHPTIWRDWTALRSPRSKVKISRQWIDSNIDQIFPFPGSFLAFHYDGTNRIQINPNRTFRQSLRMDTSGVRRDLDGFGYYTVGHEMLHYALEAKGVVPTKLHHCLILHAGDDEAPSLMEQLADFLVDDGIMAPFSRHRGLMSERLLAPCKRLKNAELRQVERFHDRLTTMGEVAELQIH